MTGDEWSTRGAAIRAELAELDRRLDALQHQRRTKRDEYEQHLSGREQ